MEEAAQVNELVLMSNMLSNLIVYETANGDLNQLGTCETNLQQCVNHCKVTMEQLNRLNCMFDQTQIGTKLSTLKPLSMQINLGKLKNKKAQKKV